MYLMGIDDLFFLLIKGKGYIKNVRAHTKILLHACMDPVFRKWAFLTYWLLDAIINRILKGIRSFDFMALVYFINWFANIFVPWMAGANFSLKYQLSSSTLSWLIELPD